MNRSYIEQRDALIPKAQKEADRLAGPEPKRIEGFYQERHKKWAKDWDVYFHRAMTTMAHELLGASSWIERD